MRLLLSIILLAAGPATAQLNLAFVGSFGHPLFQGNGNIGVCLDSWTGDVWVVDFSNTVTLHRFDAQGQLLSSMATATCSPSLPSPNGLTQDRTTGDLWLVDNEGGGRALRVVSAAHCAGGFAFTSPTPSPASIAHDQASGTLLVGSLGQVSRWSTSGAPLGGGFALTFPGFSSQVCSALAHVPATGRFLAADGASSVHEFDATGALVSSTDLSAFGVGNVQGLDYDPQTGRLLVSDNGNTTIYVFRDLAAPPLFQCQVTTTGQGDLALSVTGLPPGTFSGWTFLSGDTSLPAGQGPHHGITADQVTWDIFSAFPYPVAGNPLHWLASPLGAFPTVPFALPPGSLGAGLQGTTWDFLALAVDLSGALLGPSNVCRVTL